MTSLRLRIDGQTFRDGNNREVTLHGINVAADAKFPANPDQPSHVAEDFFQGDDVSFINRPFSVSDAHIHFTRLKRWGYNTIRYIFTWEAIEHSGPGIYDEEWIQHTIAILRIAKTYGFYIFMDPHQDTWSRFSGGSGAPMWTIYACGLDPKHFAITEAALVQNTFPEPENFPKMIWATNYTRLACQVIFTLFWAGKDFAPKAVIDGKNIQDYLQDHYLAAMKHLATRIHEAGDLENDPIIGWESCNEPNRGLVGYQDISVIPKEQQLQKGTSPTAWQAILTGSGRACEIPTWDFGGMGPFKSGSVLVDPQGQSAWLGSDWDDLKYGWKRDPEWHLGECIWAQHGVWDPSSDMLLKKDYFAKSPQTNEPMDYEYFTNHYFMEHYRKYRTTIRSVHPDAILFCQPPVLEIPPSIKGTEDDDPNMVFAPHFYDGITLLTKKWNRVWNVDVFGVLRGKYWSPAFAIKIGETAIRNCFRDELAAIRNEGTEYMGIHPCVFTEIGIPFDMDDHYAYRTGDYTSQTLAMDANHYALEASRPNGFTLWNNHQWGDQWNGEDLSIFSKDDPTLPISQPHNHQSRGSLDTTSPSYSQSQSSETTDVSPGNLKQTLTTENMVSESTRSLSETPEQRGFRAAEAYVRPTPVCTHGDLLSYGFDLRNCEFKLALTAPSSTGEGGPTVIFLPDFHFPAAQSTVEVSGGKWTISWDEEQGGPRQMLRWWHAEGDQNITVKGVKRPATLTPGRSDAEDEGYLEQCQQQRCTVM